MPTTDPVKKTAQSRNRRRRLRKEAIECLGGECAHCGNTDGRVLQFDHISPVATLLEPRGDFIAMLRSIVKEGGYKNIQLLCANCHMIKTWREGI